METSRDAYMSSTQYNTLESFIGGSVVTGDGIFTRGKSSNITILWHTLQHQQGLPGHHAQQITGRQWNVCGDSCDGFDCSFTREQKLPFDEVDEPTHGAYGLVRKVQSQITGAFLVTKEIRWSSSQPGDRLKSILSEIRIHRRLSHRHVTRIVGSYKRNSRAGNFFGIVMEPLADCDLGAFLDEMVANRESRSHVNQNELHILMDSFGCLASGLAYLHSQSVKHKDIKPANVLVYKRAVLLTDFGLSTDFSEIGRSTTSGPTGYTQKFAAPEVLNHEPRRRSADIFSLGCVFVEVLTVLAERSLSELTDRLSSATGNSYSHNIKGSIDWISEIFPKLSKQKGFLQTVQSMLSENQAQRPTAQEVWTVARCTPRTESGNGQGLCGACCQVTTDA